MPDHLTIWSVSSITYEPWLKNCTAGFSGFDGLLRILPSGKVHIHTGVGNLGTFSHSSTSRIAAEVLKVDWADVVIERGDTRRHLPWNIGQFGSNTNFTMARTNYVAAADALTKLKEIAARQFGGSPDSYDVDGKRVFRKGSPGQGLTYAAAAQRDSFGGIEVIDHFIFFRAVGVFRTVGRNRSRGDGIRAHT